jgi:hypothetical protein
MEILQLIFKTFWHFLGSLLLIYLLLYFGVNASLRAYTRTLRFFMVLRAGWPPAHLDADGDFSEVENDEIGNVVSAEQSPIEKK